MIPSAFSGLCIFCTNHLSASVAADCRSQGFALPLCVGHPFCGRDVRETPEVQAHGLLPARHEGCMR